MQNVPFFRLGNQRQSQLVPLSGIRDCTCDHVLDKPRVLSASWFSKQMLRFVVISAGVGIPGDVANGLVDTCLRAESIDGQPRVRCAMFAADRPPSFQSKKAR